jgi:hypothetical protein
MIESANITSTDDRIPRQSESMLCWLALRQAGHHPMPSMPSIAIGMGITTTSIATMSRVTNMIFTKPGYLNPRFSETAPRLLSVLSADSLSYSGSLQILGIWPLIVAP